MRRNPLSLHQLNALDASPVELITFAGRLGVPHVCVFTHSPIAAFPTVNRTNEAEVVAALSETGVEVYNVEYVAVTAEMSFDGLAEAFELSRRIGATRMTVHVFDDLEARALENFARVCRLAADQGIMVGVEWTAVNPMVNSLSKAEQFLRLSGEPDAALCVDILHLMRSGGHPADVARLPPETIGYAQISDGPLQRGLDDYRSIELMRERLPPGAGEFPTAEFIASIPAGVVIEVEAPQARAMAAGIGPFERCASSVEGARRFVV